MLIKRTLAGASMLATLVLAAPAGAASTQAALTADSIMQRIDARNPDMRTSEARVHVNGRMLTFPWYSPKLDGTYYFKRPGKTEVVFDSTPFYAHGMNKLFADINDPAGWRADSNVSFEGAQMLNGRPLLVLRMTKKVYSDQIKDTVAYVDPATFQVVRMDWHYRDSGNITMTQTFRDEGPYNVIATQHADVNHRVRATLSASYGKYQTNIAINDTVFSKQ